MAAVAQKAANKISGQCTFISSCENIALMGKLQVILLTPGELRGVGNLGFVFWILDIGFWGFGFWALFFGYSLLDFGICFLDFLSLL